MKKEGIGKTAKWNSRKEVCGENGQLLSTIKDARAAQSCAFCSRSLLMASPFAPV